MVKAMRSRAAAASDDLDANGRAERRGRPARGRAPALALLSLLLLALAGCSIGLGNPTSGGGTTIAIKVLRGQDNSTLAEVPISINGHGPYSFVLDTGASISLIDLAIARQLNLPRSGTRQPISGVGGVEQITFVDVSHWNAGALALPSSTIGSGRLPGVSTGSSLQGLLGSDILSRFGRITVDYSASTLTVYGQVAARSRPGALARSGSAWVIWRRAA